ncbi:hypothetical protein ACHAXA_007232 [Cyclostephanos tholiformis]|uniref:Uncharacterized protein n=1 Tax=Cyclostephanos tholiformis TaxID=382380 RepID=A0ABD3R513_9STRA
MLTMTTTTTTMGHHRLHDPFATDHDPCRHLAPSSSDPTSYHLLLDLLAIDDLVDDDGRISRGGVPHPRRTYEEALLASLLDVDDEFGNVDNDARRRRDRDDVGPMGAFVDMLRTDVAMDRGRGYAATTTTTTSFHDPYRRRAGGWERRRRHLPNAIDRNHRIDANDVMLHLLAVDEEVDGGKRYNAHASSLECEMIFDMHVVDEEVGGAKARALVMEDLGCLLEIDRMMNGRVLRGRNGQ